tara:strand:+ start:372 stop:1190 length:819 start_codon:yes stop_codon:yes gene_type:complete
MAEQQQMSPDQMEEMQEKIKNMSPEELREFQKQQCIFCHIISGKVQSKKIYEDDKVLAILDINPANPGHVLVLPKEHYAIMPQLSSEEIANVFMIVKTISNACLRSLGVQGTNIIVQNGVAAGQKAQHFMVHVIPRQENDGLVFDVPQKQMKEEELEKVRKQLAAHLGQKAEMPGLQPVQKAPVAERQVEEGVEPVKAASTESEPLKPIMEPPEIEVDHEREIPSQPVEEASEDDGEEEDDGVEEDDSTEEDDEEPKKEVDLDDISKILGNG